LSAPELRAALGAAAAGEAMAHSWDRVVDELDGILTTVIAAHRRPHARS